MASSSTAMGKIMRTSAWFAASCVALWTATSQAADGLDLALRTKAAVARAEPGDGAAVSTPGVGAHEAAAAHPIGHADAAWLFPLCRPHEGCGDPAEARLFYGGARRYMPAVQGLAAEGISVRRDRVVLRYSFR